MTIKKTQLTKELIEDILVNYDLGKYKKSSLIKKGHVHSNYILITENGKFILRIFEERNDEQILLEMKLLEKLSPSDIPTPKVIKTIKKEFFIKLNNKNIAIFTFLTGKHIEDENNITLKQIENLGTYLGRFHKDLTNFKPQEIKSKHIYNFDWVRKILKDIKKDLPDFPIKHETYILKILNELTLHQNLPQGLNHADLHSGNVLFEGNEVTGIVDFDDCFYGNLLSDVASGINFWCIDKSVNFEKCKCFIVAYEKERKLTSQEKDSLYNQTLLFTLIHLAYWWWLKENWHKEIKQLRVLKLLIQTPEEEFMKKLF